MNLFPFVMWVISTDSQLSDMKLYLIRSRSWAPELINEIANSKKLLEPEIFFTYVSSRLDFRRSFVSGLCSSAKSLGEERGLLSQCDLKEFNLSSF